MLLSLGALVLLPALALVDALLLRHPLGQPAQHPVRSAESPALVGNWAAAKSISYLHAARSPLPRLCADELQFIVRRTENGLGIVVDENNVVASCPGQPELRIGDQIVAVDEQRLSGHVSKALTPGAAQYVFTVSRAAESSSGSLEGALSTLCDEFASSTDEAVQKATSEKIQASATALEEQKTVASVADIAAVLKGFWKLRYTNEGRFPTSGLSGYGDAPLCSLVAHWQLFSLASPTVQVVEVIANANTGSHILAGLKGEWTQNTGSQDLQIHEEYTRIEFGGAPQEMPFVRRALTVTFVGDTTRIARVAGSDKLWIYERRPGDEVQQNVQALIATPVQREQNDRDDDDYGWPRRTGGGGGGVSPGPQLQPQPYR